ncbi:MAG: DUF433 domain-containing protein [Caldilineales bacterium]
MEFIAEPIPLAIDKDGTIRVGGTRVTLDTLVAAFRQGATAEEIVLQYPTLQLADVYAVISYYLRETAEVETYLQQQAAESLEIRKQVEARFDPAGIRDRLLARRSQMVANELTA